MNPKTMSMLARTTLVAAALVIAAVSTVAQAATQVKFATSAGDFVVELYPEKAPRTVENFLQYVKDKHYDGTIFHRVISNFMIQGGGFDANYQQKPTRAPVVHEGRQAREQGLRNVVGTLAMARTSDPQSATAQFFINVADNRRLDPTPIPPGDPVPRFVYDGEVYENTPRAELLNARKLFGYTVFGKVVSGMDVVNTIKATPTGPGGPFGVDVPKTPILINSATLVK
ncbi:MAG: peptidylprolyl isomerase [Burkholderiales bacterium RIFOXYD2_FULL_59_8]|nr:MAG: peptidylprolyl isomerase [Burkholderiales bacterium RIFOXYD2_FULL_59_8]